MGGQQVMREYTVKEIMETEDSEVHELEHNDEDRDLEELRKLL